MLNNVLITGSSGLVGSAVVRKLLFDGANYLFCPSHQELDLLDRYEVNQYILDNDIHYVIHCSGAVAGIIGNSKDNYGQMLKNLLMGVNVIDAFKHRCDLYPETTKKLMFLGSTCIYPKETEQPIKEESLLTAPLEKTNEGYALAKISCIKLCEYLNTSEKYKGKFISCMPTNVYGINDKYDETVSHVFPALIKKIIDAVDNNKSVVKIGGDGTPIRSFICSDDLANAICMLTEHYTYSEHINIGCGKGISIYELAKTIASIANYTGTFEFDKTIPNGTPIKIEDNSKILEFGWKPNISLEDGIKIVIDDYRKMKNNHGN